MAELKYDDLIADLNRDIEDKALHFTAKDGVRVTIRPVVLLNDAEMKVVQTLMKSLKDDDVSTEKQMQAIDGMLVAAADKKSSLKASLADFPPRVRVSIFETWLGSDDELGEASGSES